MVTSEDENQSPEDLLEAMRLRMKEVASTWQSRATEEDYREEDGGYYWNDEEHVGEIFISERMIKKYLLGEDIADPIEEWFEDEEESEEWREELKGYSHYIITTSCRGFTTTKDDTENPAVETPRGNTFSNEFKAWWNNFPLELLNEERADVFVMR